MNEAFFKEQMERVRQTWGIGNYPDERAKLIWQAFKDAPDHWWKAVVNDFIGNRRAAPMLKDFAADFDDFKRREAEDARNRGGGGFGEVLGNAAAKSIAQHTAIPELVRARVKLLFEFTSGQLTRQQFEEGLSMINVASIQMGGGGERPERPIHHHSRGREFAAGRDE